MIGTDPTITTLRVPVPPRRKVDFDGLIAAAALYFTGLSTANERVDRDGPLDRVQCRLIGTPSDPFDRAYQRAECRVVWLRILPDTFGLQVHVTAKHADPATRALLRGFAEGLARTWGVEVFDAPV